MPFSFEHVQFLKHLKFRLTPARYFSPACPTLIRLYTVVGPPASMKSSQLDIANTKIVESIRMQIVSFQLPVRSSRL